jgi:hypothetical protein
MERCWDSFRAIRRSIWRKILNSMVEKFLEGGYTPISSLCTAATPRTCDWAGDLQDMHTTFGPPCINARLIRPGSTMPD